MHTEDSHPDAGMDLLFSRRADLHLVPKDDEKAPSCRIGHPRIPRWPNVEPRKSLGEVAGTVVGAVLLCALCFGIPALLHFVYRF